MKKIILIFLLFILSGFGFFLFGKKTSASNHVVRLPVSFFPFVDRPNVKVEIEGKKFSLLVDLGSSQAINLHTKSLQSIKNKKPYKLSESIGVRGKTYPTQGYFLPTMKLQHMNIEGVIGFEENFDLIRDARIYDPSGFMCWLENQLELWFSQGRMGWTFFNDTVSFFDFPNKEIIIAKNLAALTDQAKCPLSTFTQIPFELKHYGIVLSIETDLGIQEILLDTGATSSILRTSVLGNRAKENQITYTTHQFKVASTDFGPLDFLLFEYANLFECDAILGTDFFKKHQVCLDFQSKTAYIK